MGTTTMYYTMHHVVDAINQELKDEFLKFPTTQELRINEERNFEKYHHPNFAFAVDGCHFVFKANQGDFLMVIIKNEMKFVC